MAELECPVHRREILHAFGAAQLAGFTIAERESAAVGDVGKSRAAHQSVFVVVRRNRVVVVQVEEDQGPIALQPPRIAIDAGLQVGKILSMLVKGIMSD